MLPKILSMYLNIVATTFEYVFKQSKFFNYSIVSQKFKLLLTSLIFFIALRNKELKQTVSADKLLQARFFFQFETEKSYVKLNQFKSCRTINVITKKCSNQFL